MSRAVMRFQGVLLGVAMRLNLPAPPAAQGGAPALACFRARSPRKAAVSEGIRKARRRKARTSCALMASQLTSARHEAVDGRTIRRQVALLRPFAAAPRPKHDDPT